MVLTALYLERVKPTGCSTKRHNLYTIPAYTPVGCTAKYRLQAPSPRIIIYNWPATLPKRRVGSYLRIRQPLIDVFLLFSFHRML